MHLLCIYSSACKVSFVRSVKVNFMEIRLECLDNAGPMSSSYWQFVTDSYVYNNDLWFHNRWNSHEQLNIC